MPITNEDAPDVLPGGAKRIYVSAFNSAYGETCKDSSDKDECAAKIAWTAVKSKYTKSGDEWVAKAEEFSLAVQKVSYDKATNEMRWKAVASDTLEDKRKDNMTQELYDDFLSRIESNDPPPEQYQSEFWAGGKPYLSVSHYEDLNGDGVPGPTDAVYVDGKAFNAKGRFDDTPLGRACFQALNEDLYGNKENAEQDKVRISIAFLDWTHRHKKTDFLFERKSADELCPECLLEMFTGEGEGKEYLRGQLIHLALTRIPVNPRTLMEVDKSMTTKQEDAASIVGDELADDLEELTKVDVTKSEALVIKAKDEKDDEEDDEEEEDGKKKKKDKKEMKSEVPSWLGEFKADFETIKSLIPDPVPSHPLDDVLAQFKSEFDEAMDTDLTSEEKLQLVQESYSAIGAKVQELAQPTSGEDEPKSDSDDLVAAFSKALRPMEEQIALLNQKFSERTQAPATVPQPRSIQPTMAMQKSGLQPKESPGVKKSETPGLRSVIEKTTF